MHMIDAKGLYNATTLGNLDSFHVVCTPNVGTFNNVMFKAGASKSAVFAQGAKVSARSALLWESAALKHLLQEMHTRPLGTVFMLASVSGKLPDARVVDHHVSFNLRAVTNCDESSRTKLQRYFHFSVVLHRPSDKVVVNKMVGRNTLCVVQHVPLSSNRDEESIVLCLEGNQGEALHPCYLNVGSLGVADMLSLYVHEQKSVDCNLAYLADVLSHAQQEVFRSLLPGLLHTSSGTPLDIEFADTASLEVLRLLEPAGWVYQATISGTHCGFQLTQLGFQTFSLVVKLTHPKPLLVVPPRPTSTNPEDYLQLTTWTCLTYMHESDWSAEALPRKIAAVQALEPYTHGGPRKYFVKESAAQLPRMYFIALLVVESGLRDSQVPHGATDTHYRCIIEGRPFVHRKARKEGCFTFMSAHGLPLPSGRPQRRARAKRRLRPAVLEYVSEADTGQEDCWVNMF
eukprot:6458320-Amphidinium_carterae.2